jgi:2,4'-dihydroxyacetophenone dioxygenase
MTDTASGAEFWRDLKPITRVFQPDALPEVYIPDVTSLEDMRYFVPLSETVYSRPVWISIAQNRWADILYSDGAGLVNRHYHPHQVFAYTISGKWGYLEHDWIATAGDFVYETPGEGHTLVAYESDEPMLVHFNVTGPLIWLDEDGNSLDHFDVHNYIAMCREHYEANGLGADYVDSLLR